MIAWCRYDILHSNPELLTPSLERLIDESEDSYRAVGEPGVIESFSSRSVGCCDGVVKSESTRRSLSIGLATVTEKGATARRRSCQVKRSPTAVRCVRRSAERWPTDKFPGQAAGHRCRDPNSADLILTVKCSLPSAAYGGMRLDSVCAG